MLNKGLFLISCINFAIVFGLSEIKWDLVQGHYYDQTYLTLNGLDRDYCVQLCLQVKSCMMNNVIVIDIAIFPGS